MNGNSLSFESLMGLGVPGNSMGMIEGLVSPSVIPTDIKPEEFQSLLDIVSDLEVAETQNVGFVETFESDLLGQFDSGQRNLLNAKNESAIVNQMQAWIPTQKGSVNLQDKIVGQLPTAMTEVETIDPKAIVLGATLELGALEKLHKQNSQRVSVEQKGEAVQAWALALATGDMKAVDVIGDKEPELQKIAQVTESFVPLKEQVANPTDIPKEFPKAVKLDTPIQEASKPQDKVGLEVSRGFERIKPPVVSSADVQPLETKRAPEQIDSALKSETPNKPSPIEKTESGSEFLLKEQTKTPKRIQVASGAEDTQAFLPAASIAAVRDADQLGEPGDKRLNPQTLGLVAEKVDALKAQGGGTLRVELAPKELGAIEIRVTQRPSGLVMVKLSAEKISTREALGASQADLAMRIEQGGAAARVEVSSIGMNSQQLSPSAMVQTRVTPVINSELASANVDVNRGTLTQSGQGRDMVSFGMSTHDFKGLMEAGTKMDFRNSNGFDHSRNPNFAGEHRGFEGRGSGQETSRERAFDQWSSLFEQKKSA